MSLLAIIYLIVDLVRYQTNSQYKEWVDNKIRQAKIPAYYDNLRPRTAVEKRLFGFLSFSAGVLEEVLYRGYLISLLSDGLNNTWIAVVAAALLFGIGHLYQGLGGILKTFIIGILMGIIFVGTGSIINCILLHILIDISSSFYSSDEPTERYNNPSLSRT
jgi:membrane protease YdiL (CAAX protease family)